MPGTGTFYPDGQIVSSVPMVIDGPGLGGKKLSQRFSQVRAVVIRFPCCFNVIVWLDFRNPFIPW